MPAILYLPFQKSIEADGRRTLLELARELGVPLQAPCGGKRICGRCRVIVEVARDLLPPLTERERETLGEGADQGYRLACETVLSGEARVRIPEESQIHPPVILTSDGLDNIPARLRPAVEPYYLEVPSPTLPPAPADRERLLEALAVNYGLNNVTVDPLVLRDLPGTLRARENKVTAAVRNRREIVGVFPGRKERLLGLGVDIGTTTLAVYLLDLLSGRRLAISSGLNPQVRFGDEVIGRIAFSQKTPHGSDRLTEAVRSGINDLIGQVAEQAEVRPEEILEAVLVGNTAMHHFFLGLETRYLAQAPYTPAVCEGLVLKGRDAGLAINPSAAVRMLPLKAGFVGSDMVAGILATGLYRSRRVKLLLDLGTNGEMVLGNRDRLLCCSTAAGPAFEGGHIRAGMRASPGAIDRVRIDPETLEPTLRTIAGRTPEGLCGSGIFSIVAEMLRRGILLARGDFNADRATPRLRNGPDGREWVLHYAAESSSGRDIVFSQKDAAELLMAKAAVQAGVALLREMLGTETIEAVLLAGAFGNYIDPADAQILGVIPPLAAKKVRGVGNSAGYGACLSVLDETRTREADRIARKMEYVELAGNRRFAELLVKSLLFDGAEDYEDFR